ncbi:MAG: serine/threonine-protein kinase [Vicinamibacterales bacterium]
MARGHDDDRFESIASAIADGDPVEWAREEAEVSAEHTQILRELQSLEAIAAAHSQLRLTFGDAEVTTDLPGFAPTSLRSWGHLTIIAKIDEGAFGSVYKAHDNRLAKDVALKLLPSRGTDPARMLKEARLLAKVNHPNVVRVYGADDTQERVGLWMELIKGRTLESLLKTQGAFGAREAALIGLDVCHAVAAVHHAGLVHGDIKAHNVMREEGGRTVLMDFGASHDPTMRAREQKIVGTPVYLAPEVLSGQPQSRASDIYAIGVLLYHLVTDTYPVGGQSWTDVVSKHERGESMRLRDARPDLPEEFVRAVEQAIAANPAMRYESAGTFAAALSHFIEPSSRHIAARRPSRTIVVGLVAGIAFAAIASWLWRAAPATSPEPASRVSAPTAAPSSASAPAGASYEIDAGFYRVTDAAAEPLGPETRLAIGDRLFFTVQATVPTFLYIVNEPEQGEPFLLFPLPGSRVQNPLPANQRVRVPGDLYWQVTSAGGREHFVVFASPDRVPAFEEAFAALATPSAGRAPRDAAPLPSATAERLRGVGGLVSTVPPGQAGARFSSLFTTPMSGRREAANGLWVRRLTVENPAR